MGTIISTFESFVKIERGYRFFSLDNGVAEFFPKFSSKYQPFPMTVQYSL